MNICDMGDEIRISSFGEINLGLTLDCGQAFRWKLLPDGFMRGAAYGREIDIAEKNGELIIRGSCERDVREIWADYFDLGRDYEKVREKLMLDGVTARAREKYGCIRILNQEPWEALCSFIISSCNNIPRIRGIVERLCEGFGEKLNTLYSFPSAETIASTDIGELEIIRAGYRLPFIKDAARRVASGETKLDEIKKMPLDEAERELMKINGVGKKVADCTLLFGMGRAECFPVDRHIKRITESCYEGGLPECFDGIGGIAQQYLFCEARNI